MCQDLQLSPSLAYQTNSVLSSHLYFHPSHDSVMYRTCCQCLHPACK
jgi:hypothetical protein